MDPGIDGLSVGRSRRKPSRNRRNGQSEKCQSRIQITAIISLTGEGSLDSAARSVERSGFYFSGLVEVLHTRFAELTSYHWRFTLMTHCEATPCCDRAGGRLAQFSLSFLSDHSINHRTFDQPRRVSANSWDATQGIELPSKGLRHT